VVDEGRRPLAGATLGKDRMEAFSDGVLAIAITLLVLDLAVRPPGSPLHQFLRAWPAYVAYLVAFLSIGAAWLAHNGLTDRMDRVDPLFLRLNLLFLLAVSFLPFPTRLVAEALERSTDWKRLGAVVFGLTMLVIRLLFAAMGRYARRGGLRHPREDDPDYQEAHKKFRGAAIAYVVSIAIGFVVPLVSILAYFAIAIFLVVPFRAVWGELFRKSSA